MKWHKKPFTLFLYVMIIVLIIFGTKTYILDLGFSGQGRESEVKDGVPWTGIISLWDISYVETGTGTNQGWLNNRVRDFERQNPGVFIDIRRLSPKRIEVYLNGGGDIDILPDIISISPYEKVGATSLYRDLGAFFTGAELERILPIGLNRVLKDGGLWGVPIMTGTYGLFVNLDILGEKGISIEDILGDAGMDFSSLDTIIRSLPHTKKEGKKELRVFGFTSYNTAYSRPILSLLYDDNSGSIGDSLGYRYLMNWVKLPGLVPDNINTMDSKASLKLFIDERCAGVFLGDTQAIYRNRMEKSKGKGFEMGIYNLPAGTDKNLLQDRVASYGIVKRDDTQKLGHSVAFLKSLLDPDSQRELAKIGMFPIVRDIGYIYEDDFEMLELEKSLGNFGKGPWDDMFSEKQGLWYSLFPETNLGSPEDDE